MADATKRKPAALTLEQERKLVDYLDAEFMEMTRGYKKRSEPTTHLPTLARYLESASKLLGLILQIPPIDPSTSLRTSYLLHLTNDVVSSVVGYPPEPQSVVDLLDWLDDLDQAWVAVLRAQIWDPAQGAGVDLVVDADDMDVVRSVKGSPVSQTETTRLRSLLLGAVETFEEWLFVEGDEGQENHSAALDEMGLRERFNEVFSGTMDELGGFEGLLLQRLSVKETCTPETDRMDDAMEE